MNKPKLLLPLSHSSLSLNNTTILPLIKSKTEVIFQIYVYQYMHTHIHMYSQDSSMCVYLCIMIENTNILAVFFIRQGQEIEIQQMNIEVIT